ncbi:MAG: hypothetical protein KJO07_13695 [Deltaproteobacteria bacterium]|nr:hypothetical protein [Deltaproteobacteria bacterium]
MQKRSLFIALGLVVGCAGQGDVVPGDPETAPREPAADHVPTRLYPGPCQETVDTDLDEAAELIKLFRYDDHDRLIVREFDTFADGLIDYRHTITFDGQRIVRETDSHGNGIIDVRDVSFLNTAGQEVGREKDSDGDGRVDYLLSRSFVVDGPALETVDRDGDGSFDDGTHWTYEGGLLVRRTRFDGAQQAQSITYFEVVGPSTEQELVDGDGDGNIDRATTSHYDGDLLLLVEVDSDYDGNPDSAVSYQYQDSLVAVESYDSDADGDADLVTGYQYDQHGQLILQTLDDGADGKLDRAAGREYQDGRLVLSWIDHDGDGSLDEQTRNTWDQFGNLLRTDRDRDGNGAFESATVYDYSCFAD